MRLFIAREALDPHLKVGGAIFNTTLPMSDRAKAVFTSGKFYAGWYPRQWWSTGAGKIDNLHDTLRGHAAPDEHDQFLNRATAGPGNPVRHRRRRQRDGVM